MQLLLAESFILLPFTVRIRGNTYCGLLADSARRDGYGWVILKDLPGMCETPLTVVDLTTSRETVRSRGYRKGVTLPRLLLFAIRFKSLSDKRENYRMLHGCSATHTPHQKKKKKLPHAGVKFLFLNSFIRFRLSHISQHHRIYHKAPKIKATKKFYRKPRSCSIFSV